jgi:hypothetical protein
MDKYKDKEMPDVGLEVLLQEGDGEDEDMVEQKVDQYAGAISVIYSAHVKGEPIDVSVDIESLKQKIFSREREEIITTVLELMGWIHPGQTTKVAAEAWKASCEKSNFVDVNDTTKCWERILVCLKILNEQHVVVEDTKSARHGISREMQRKDGTNTKPRDGMQDRARVIEDRHVDLGSLIVLKEIRKDGASKKNLKRYQMRVFGCSLKVVVDTMLEASGLGCLRSTFTSNFCLALAGFKPPEVPVAKIPQGHKCVDLEIGESMVLKWSELGRR